MKKDSDLEFGTMPRKAGQLFLFMVRPYKTRTFLFFFLTFLGIVAWTASPVLVADVVNRLSESPQLDAYIWFLVAAYFVARVLDELLWRAGEILMRTYKPQMIERIRSMLFSEALKKSYAYSVNSSSGQVGHWINRTTSTANEFVDTTIWTVWGRIMGLTISAFFLFLVHWSIGLLFVVWLVALFWYTTHRGKRFGDLVALQSEEESKASGMVVDALTNHLSVRVFNAQIREQRRLHAQQQRIVGRWRDSWIQNIKTNVVKGQSAAFVSAIALVAVLLLYSNGVVPLGGVVLFIAYFGDASSSLWTLAWALDSYYRNFGTIQNGLDGLKGEYARQGTLVAKEKIPKQATITLDNLSFAYPDRKEENVLNSISVEIRNGQKVGIVGHSGAGKSTLAGLLLGFYEPTQGHLLVNNEDVADKDPSYIRAISAFVPQDTSLFNRTIRENILYARPEASEKELEHALKRAEALEFIGKLPKGLETLIGERGVKLSGGQRQRIAIARAILKDAPLLLLDEATSALDSVSEQAIQKAFHDLMKDRTSIVIAHRLSTLRHLDNILVIEKGQIAEQGTHEELIKQNGIYADLWMRQKDGFIID